MPIRINLLAEAQAMEEARRRDPVKRAVLVSAILVGVMLLWGGIEFPRTIVVRAELQRSEREWEQNKPHYEALVAKEKVRDDYKKRVDLLTQLTVNRFLWGNVLNALQQATIKDVQLVRLNGINEYTVFQPLPPVRAAGQRTPPPQTGHSIERVTLVMEARDSGNQAEQNYVKLMEAIMAVPYFKSSLTNATPITLKNMTQPVANAQDPSKSSFNFVLECKFPEKKIEEGK